MMVLVDDRSRYTWVHFLRNQSDAPRYCKEWLTRIERVTERKLKIVRSDNGGEYTSNTFEKYLADLGIDHQITAPCTSQQNGIAERTNRTVVERTIALMHSERIPINLWAEVMDSVVYLKNRSPSRALNRSTPFEALTGERPISPMCELLGVQLGARSLRPNEITRSHLELDSAASLGMPVHKRHTSYGTRSNTEWSPRVMSPSMNLYRQLGLNDLRLLWPNLNRTLRFFILNHHVHTLMLRTHRSDMMSSKQWEIYLVRRRQWNSIVQWEQEKRKGEKSHRSHPSEDITNFKAGTTRSILGLLDLLLPLQSLRSMNKQKMRIKLRTDL